MMERVSQVGLTAHQRSQAEFEDVSIGATP